MTIAVDLGRRATKQTSKQNRQNSLARIILIFTFLRQVFNEAFDFRNSSKPHEPQNIADSQLCWLAIRFKQWVHVPGGMNRGWLQNFMYHFEGYRIRLYSQNFFLANCQQSCKKWFWTVYPMIYLPKWILNMVIPILMHLLYFSFKKTENVVCCAYSQPLPPA